MKRAEEPRLSVIIPVRDEVESVPGLAKEIQDSLGDGPWSWECVWIDDGSADGTPETLERLSAEDSRHRPVIFERNYGQSVALAEGFRRARGEIFATLDGDGQNDPADIPPLLRRLDESGADMVNGWRRKRKDSVIRRISSKLGNGFRNWVTGDAVRDVGCSMRVFRRECVENIPVFRGLHRFLPTLARVYAGAKIDEMPVNHRPRRLGRTKYGIHNRLWVGLADTLAVRWMRSRMQVARPEVREAGAPGERKGS